MDYYSQIKQEFIQNEITKKVKDYSKNRSDLETYYKVGKLIVEAQGGQKKAKYGNGLIKKYSQQLTLELNKKYSERNLRNMRQFYLLFQSQNWNTVCAKLTWSHYRELIWFDSIDKINYYIKISIQYNLSVRELITKIKSNEYERLDDVAKNKLANQSEVGISDFIKNPILIRNSSYYHLISEKLLKQLILEDIDHFLTELGDGFSYIKNEYKIKIGDYYHYIDLLLFNYIYNCFVVVELKVTELKAEYIGQIKKYMNYIDKNLRNFHQENTIGIIITKKDNQFIMEYCSDERVFRTTYVLN